MSLPQDVKDSLDAKTRELNTDVREQTQKIGSLMGKLLQKKNAVYTVDLKLPYFDYGTISFRAMRQKEANALYSSAEWKRSLEALEDKTKPLTEQEMNAQFRLKNRFLGACIVDVVDGLATPIGEAKLNDLDDIAFTNSMFDKLLEASGMTLKTQEAVESFPVNG